MPRPGGTVMRVAGTSERVSIVPIRKRPRWKRVLRFPATLWKLYHLAPAPGDTPLLKLRRAWLIACGIVRN